MSSATVIEAIQLPTFAMWKDAKMEVKSFTAWNALPKTTSTILINPLKLNLNYRQESKIGKTLLKMAKS
jgi:hypothetical protein